MLDRLLISTRLLAAAQSVLFTILMIPILAWTTGNWIFAMLTAVPAGLLFGGTMAAFGRREERAQTELSGDLSDDHRDAARIASVKGPVPDDPQVRDVAATLAERHHHRLRRSRWMRVALAFVIVPALVVPSVTGTPVGLGVVAGIGVVAAFALEELHQARFRRRADLLRSAADG